MRFFFKGPLKFVWLGLIGLMAWWFSLPVPLFDSSYSTVLLDQHDQLLGARLANDGQWRFPGKDLEVPVTFEKAILQFEDKRFITMVEWTCLLWPGRSKKISVLNKS